MLPTNGNTSGPSALTRVLVKLIKLKISIVIIVNKLNYDTETEADVFELGA